MSKTNGSASLTTLENRVASLGVQARDLQNRIDAKEDSIVRNSLPIFTTGAFNTDMASTASLAFNNAYAPLTLQYQTLMFTYKSQPVIQNTIDMPVQDALKGGVDFRSDELDKDDIKEFEEKLDDMQFYLQVKTLEEWARLFGGAAMVINTDQDPATPLNLNKLYGHPLRFYPASRWELQSSRRYAEEYVFYGQRFHKSRILTVSGKEAPYQIRWMLQDWGLSEMEKLLEPFNIYLRTQNAIYDLLKEAKVDIFQFEGFLSQLSSNKGTQLAIQRVQMMNMAKSSSNALVMDMKDKYEQKVMTFSGLAEMCVQNRISLASATRIPINKLFGTGAQGFSSGEDDLENYIMLVESEVREHMRPSLKELFDLVAINLWGESFDMPFDYKPLRVVSYEVEEQIKTSKHARYFQDMQAGMLTPQEYMQLQQKEKLIPIETEVARGATPEPMMVEAQPEEKEEKPQGGKKE
jgi:phage-related protein (TIGR01555 family)